MQFRNPIDFAMGMPSALLKWAQDIFQGLSGGLDQGIPQSKDSTGNYNTFNQGNLSGVLIRVGAAGSSGNKYLWTTNNTPIDINHGLFDSNRNKRQPVGAYLVNSDKALSIFEPTAPDTTTIHIAPTDATANATIYVF